MPQPTIVEGEEEWEVKQILNKRKVWGRDKFLVWWKGFTAEGDTVTNFIQMYLHE